MPGIVEGMMKVYARDCMSKAVVNLQATETETFEQLLEINVYLSANDVVQASVFCCSILRPLFFTCCARNAVGCTRVIHPGTNSVLRIGSWRG